MSHTSRTAGTAAILRAQDEGYQAYLNGVAIPECPYDGTQPELRTAWTRGYAASRTDRARANREASSNSLKTD
ncbi:ribosome modulation factor [Micrococcaceae sp. AOP34-BR2-30]